MDTKVEALLPSILDTTFKGELGTVLKTPQRNDGF
jgi:hypothetical protein